MTLLEDAIKDSVVISTQEIEVEGIHPNKIERIVELNATDEFFCTDELSEMPEVGDRYYVEDVSLVIERVSQEGRGYRVTWKLI